RTFRPIHVDRQPKYETDGLTRLGELKKPGGIGPKPLAGNRLDADREAPVGIANRNPDGLGAEIETEEHPAVRQSGRELGQRQDQRRHEPRSSTPGPNGQPARLPEQMGLCYRALAHPSAPREAPCPLTPRPCVASLISPASLSRTRRSSICRASSMRSWRSWSSFRSST